ncbi:MAG: hypothetical protein D6785_15820, partial [Planctomycetota bacterium]
MADWVRNRKYLEWGWGRVIKVWETPRGKRVKALFGKNRQVLFDLSQDSIEISPSPNPTQGQLRALLENLKEKDALLSLEAENQLVHHLKNILSLFSYPNTPQGFQAFQKELFPHSHLSQQELIQEFQKLVDQRREQLSEFFRISAHSGFPLSGFYGILQKLPHPIQQEIREILVPSLVDIPQKGEEYYLLLFLDFPTPSLVENLWNTLLWWGREHILFPFFHILEEASWTNPSVIAAFKEIHSYQNRKKLLLTSSSSSFDIPPEKLFFLLLSLKPLERKKWFQNQYGKKASKFLQMIKVIEKEWKRIWKFFELPKRESLFISYIEKHLGLSLLHFWKEWKEWIKNSGNPSGLEKTLSLRPYLAKIPFPLQKEIFQDSSWSLKKAILKDLIEAEEVEKKKLLFFFPLLSHSELKEFFNFSSWEAGYTDKMEFFHHLAKGENLALEELPPNIRNYWKEISTTFLAQDIWSHYYLSPDILSAIWKALLEKEEFYLLWESIEKQNRFLDSLEKKKNFIEILIPLFSSSLPPFLEEKLT